MALRLGQQVDIELDLDTGPIKVTGEVVRVDTPDLLEDQIAVRFVNTAPEVKTAIRDVVARQLAAAEDDDAAGDEETTRGDPVVGKLGDDEPEIELETDD